MAINTAVARQLLQDFQFSDLFIQQLGWSYPDLTESKEISVENLVFSRQFLAELCGVRVIEITTPEIPNAKDRLTIYQEVAKTSLENLLIFLDEKRTQSVWYWVKRHGNRLLARDRVYNLGAPGDLLLSQISALHVSFAELEQGDLSVIDIADRLQKGFDLEKVTKRFFDDFQKHHQDFLHEIKGIEKESDRRWYASVLLNRLMLLYFLQKKGFLDGGNLNYLQDKLAASQERGKDVFYQKFLLPLFFEGLAKLPEDRSPEVVSLIGDIIYLDGGLFLKHSIEENYKKIKISDQGCQKILDLFGRYSWNLDDTPQGKDNEINPAVLGYIFEKYINQKAFGAYYTRTEITEYLCDRTINKLILDRLPNRPALAKSGDLTELFTHLDASLCHHLIHQILPNLTLLDPACGSGAFLVAAMKTLIYIYSAVITRIKYLNDPELSAWLQDIEREHPSLDYYIKKQIITDNLYGVDIMPEATEIAKLRLFLALVGAARTIDELEPLPNIDFNIMAGNSLIGLIKVDQDSFEAIKDKSKGGKKGKKDQENLVQPSLLQPLSYAEYQKLLVDKNYSIQLYKKHAFLRGEVEGTSQDSRLLEIRKHIEGLHKDSQAQLNQLLLKEFSEKLGIKYEAMQITGKAEKRVLTPDDMEKLQPFHWGYHFDKVLAKGGFDAIITNPPWETFEPNAKEFFSEYSDIVSKNKMDIKDFEIELKSILLDDKIKEKWLKYQSQFHYQREFFRFAQQYKNQVPIINGKRHGKDVNLYKLFLEQCFNLLRDGGECGIVIPSGIYTDLGAKKLREILFNETQVSGLFCLENRRSIFEGVHKSFKFVVLTFEKGGKTVDFPSAFMRLDVAELQSFPSEESLKITVEMVRKMSPDSLSVMEFKNQTDIAIAEKMLQFPLLGEEIADKWNLELHREFNMTDDAYLFHKEQGKYILPLYEGKMIHQFNHKWGEPKYWLDEQEARAALLGKKETDNGQILDYQTYRFAYRAIARNTDERTLIGTILPKNVVCGNSLNIASPNQDNKSTLFICSLLNSFCVDFALRQKVSANINMFYIYQLPIPRLTENDPYFNEIVNLAAQLICTTPEFDDLAKSVGLSGYEAGVTDTEARGKIRAKLDGMIAHLYGLTEAEFAYILTTFPVVEAGVKEAALEAYR